MSQITADENVLDEIVRRLVDAVDPDRIVLFGSRARDDARPDSDYDLLIVTRGFQRDDAFAFGWLRSNADWRLAVRQSGERKGGECNDS